MPAAATTEYRLAELILPFSLAVDLGTGGPMEGFLRATLLAANLGDKLGLAETALGDVYYLSLLRFSGCTAAAHLSAAAFGDEQAFRQQTAILDYGKPAEMMRAMLRSISTDRSSIEALLALARAMGTILRERYELSNAHCQVAQRLAARLGMSQAVVNALGQSFERWDGKRNMSSPLGLKGEAIAPAARVVQVAHSVEALHRAGGIEMAVNMVSQWAGSWLDPNVVACFRRHAAELCHSMETENPWEAALAAEPGPRPRLTPEQLAEGIQAMADFVDLQQPYMTGHSSAVARLARQAAQRLGLPPAELTVVQRAALLHDLGRVSVPAATWSKREPLRESERERIRLHPYYTERILARSRPLAQYGQIGALHHERLDGSGYHRGLPASLLPPVARILAAADVYQALISVRPHRAAASPDQAASALKQEVRAGRLDGEAANAVLAAAGQAAPVRGAGYRAGLTEREVEVLRLLAHGLTNRAIAQQLSIAPKTVDNHLQSIYSKLGVTTRAAATFFAMQHHLV